MSSILLKCGHTANAVKTYPNGDQKPACAICLCDEPAVEVPSLDGRKARCTSCGKEVNSSYSLAFFKYKGDVTSSDQASVHVRNELLQDLWKNKDEVQKAKMKQALSILNRKIEDTATRDSYYCGCRGWD